MGNTVQTDFGKIVVSSEAIAQLAYKAASECFGVVGLSSKNLTQLLTGENRGVEVRVKDTGIHIKIQISVIYGTKISEIAKNISDSVHYSLKQNAGVSVEQLEVKIAGIKVAN